MNFAGIFSKIFALLSNQIKNDPALNRFIAHNKKVWGSWKNKNPSSEILVDFFPLYGAYLGREYGLNVLAKKYNANIIAYSSKPFLNLKMKTLYRSFNISQFLQVRFSKKIKSEALKIAKKSWAAINTKELFVDFVVDECNIGMDIYETYLRECHQPTLNFQDKKLKKNFLRGISTHLYWKKYFSSHKVSALLTSHNCYIEFNTPIRLALKYGIPVYLVDPTGAHKLIDLNGPYNDFLEYKKYFTALSSEKQKEALNWAKSRLDLRLKGVAGVDMPYSTVSAFGEKSKNSLLRSSENTKVLICSHCFYDNPHAYSKILFPDFFEWLKFLNETAAKTDYDWYLKTHPDYLPGTLETINLILGENSKIKILPPNASHRQIADEGLDYALTVYGTVGVEYPLLGVQVISLGYNPRTSFDFNFCPQSISEYEKLLLTLNNSPKKNLDAEKVYQAYYIFYQYVRLDDLVYPSYREMLKALPGERALSSEAYSYFLGTFQKNRHENIIARLSNFFNSSESHLYALEQKS